MIQIEAPDQTYTLTQIIQPISDFLKIADSQVLRKKNEHCAFFVAGGAITSLFVGEKPRDIDIFCTHKELITKLRIYLKSFDRSRSMSRKGLVIRGYKWKESKRAINIQIDNYFYQFIKDPVGDPAFITENFDFTICMAAWYPFTRIINCSQNYLQDVASRMLRINKLPYPFSTLYRMMKFIKRGYKIRGADVTKIAVGINALAINDWEDLKMHTGGYLSGAPTDLSKEKQEDEEERKYLLDILDSRNGVIGSRLDPAHVKGLAPDMAKEEKIKPVLKKVRKVAENDIPF